MTIVQIAAAFTAFTTLSIGIWTAGDYTRTRPVILKEFQEAQNTTTDVLQGIVEQQNKMLTQQSLAQEQLTTSLMELQFQTLDMKRKDGPLEWAEQQNYCRIAKRLDYVNVQGCEH